MQDRAPTERGRILVVDDQRNMRATTAMLLRAEGFSVEEAGSGEEALGLLAKAPTDLMLTDLKMEPMDGLELLQARPGGQPADAGHRDDGLRQHRDRRWRRCGAAPTTTSPSPSRRASCCIRVQKALERSRLVTQVNLFAEEFHTRHGLSSLVGRSAAMRDLTSRIARVAPSDATVLIQGESRHRQGAGRPRAAHPLAPRTARPSCRSTAPPSPRRCWRASCSATPRAPSPAR